MTRPALERYLELLAGADHIPLSLDEMRGVIQWALECEARLKRVSDALQETR